MAVTPFKTFAVLEVLTHTDLNSSFSKIFDNGEDLAWPATKAKDMNAQELILDDDEDTSITADTDDQIDLRLGGVDLFNFNGATASVVNGLTFTGAASGSATTITATSSGSTDANVSINWVTVGTGVLQSNGTTLTAIEDDDYHLSAQVYGG